MRDRTTFGQVLGLCLMLLLLVGFAAFSATFPPIARQSTLAGVGLAPGMGSAAARAEHAGIPARPAFIGSGGPGVRIPRETAPWPKTCVRLTMSPPRAVEAEVEDGRCLIWVLVG